jgi:hypothetical protein
LRGRQPTWKAIRYPQRWRHEGHGNDLSAYRATLSVVRTKSGGYTRSQRVASQRYHVIRWQEGGVIPLWALPLHRLTLELGPLSRPGVSRGGDSSSAPFWKVRSHISLAGIRDHCSSDRSGPFGSWQTAHGSRRPLVLLPSRPSSTGAGEGRGLSGPAGESAVGRHAGQSHAQLRRPPDTPSATRGPQPVE